MTLVASNTSKEFLKDEGSRLAARAARKTQDPFWVSAKNACVCVSHFVGNTCLIPRTKPYLVLMGTLCSCEAYGMRPTYKGTKVGPTPRTSRW